MKKQALFPAAAVICLVVILFLGFFLGRITAVSGTTLTPLSQSLIPPTASSPESVFSPASTPIDINTADIEVLQQLPGIGESIAVKIIEYRDANGPFSDISELLNVNGIGQKRLETIETMICIGETP